MTTTPKCLQQVFGRGWTQETYETASRDATVRAKVLRAAGYAVNVGSLGPQVTPLGTIKLTLVDIRPGHLGLDTADLPPVERVEWPRH